MKKKIQRELNYPSLTKGASNLDYILGCILIFISGFAFAWLIFG